MRGKQRRLGVYKLCLFAVARNWTVQVIRFPLMAFIRRVETEIWNF